jgi:hypothetical protein
MVRNSVWRGWEWVWSEAQDKIKKKKKGKEKSLGRDIIVCLLFFTGDKASFILLCSREITTS